MLTPIMIRPMRWTPLSLTLLWKTMPVMAEEAITITQRANDERLSAPTKRGSVVPLLQSVSKEPRWTLRQG